MAAFTPNKEIDLILRISSQIFQGYSISVLTRVIGLAAALSLITGIDRKARQYKNSKGGDSTSKVGRGWSLLLFF